MMGPIDFPVGYRLPSHLEQRIRATAARRQEEATARPAPRPVRAHRLHWRRRPVVAPTLS